jgi:hypothetical protein
LGDPGYQAEGLFVGCGALFAGIDGIPLFL